MSFFYNLNNKLNAIRELPETTHRQLNESKPDFLDLDRDGDTKEPMKKAAKEKPDYKANLQDKFGGSADDLTKGLSIKSKKVDEAGMSRAAKGMEKYGKDGMQALAKAGREGRALDPIRNKFNKYDESIAEDAGYDGSEPLDLSTNPSVNDVFKRALYIYDYEGYGNNMDYTEDDAIEQYVASKFGQDVLDQLTDAKAQQYFGRKDGRGGGRYRSSNLGMALDKPGDFRTTKAGKMHGQDAKTMKARVADRLGRHPKPNLPEQGMEEGSYSKDAMELNPDFAKVGKKPGVMGKIAKGIKRVADFVAPGDEDLLRDLERKTGGRRPTKEAAPMSAKQKSFAALAEPKDKVTFADKIAGAKKEVDEMLGDVAAEAMKAALGKKQVTGMGEATKEIPGGRRHTSEPGGYGRKDDEDAPRVQTQRGRGRPKNRADSETGEVMKPDFSAFGVGGKVNLPKHKGTVTKHKMSDKEPGEKVKEAADYGQAQQIYNDLADVRAAAKQAQRGGEFPQGFATRLESVLWSAMTLIKNQQPGNAQVSEEELDEKAVSKKQQRFMGMVSAAKKGEKPASKEVAKVAKTMKKGDAEDFAKTKHKGLPEKAKAKDSDKKSAKEEKVEETTTSGSVATAPAAGGKKSSGGINFGGGIYDSMNRDLENMISESMSRLDESMNISMNMNSDSHGGPTKSLTITATDDDADKLAMMLKMAGLGSSHDHGESYTEAAHMVDENKPDYPTEPEYSNDAFQYSGGLNKPKRDVAGDGQATGTVTAVHATQEDDEDNLAEAADSNMADQVRDLVGDFDRNMTQMRVYGDPDVDRAIAYLKQGNAEAAVEAVVDTYGDQDGGEFRNMSDYAKDLLSDFESLIGPGSDHEQVDEIAPVLGAIARTVIPSAVNAAMSGDDETNENQDPGQDDLDRMMEMAGVKKKPVDEEKTEEGNKFTGNLAKARAAGKKEADLDGDGKMEKVDESIFDMTRKLWNTYKG